MVDHIIEIWAKSAKDSQGNPITLRKHTEDVSEAFGQLLKHPKVKDTLGKLLPEFIRLIILLHDLGKVHPAFQIKKLKNKKYLPFDIYDEVPHSLFSLFWINLKELKKKISKIVNNNSEETECYYYFVLSAIAFHHWRESFNDFLTSNNYILSGLNKKGDWWLKLKQNLSQHIGNLSVHGYTIDNLLEVNEKWIEGLGNGIALADYVVPPYQLYYLPRRAGLSKNIMRDWVLMSGFTMLSDHFASFCEEEQEEIKNIEIEPLSKSDIEDKIVKKINLPRAEIWQFNIAPQHSDKNTILIAPTGFGKTEFSWIWANGEKFFYSLPLRSAVNQNFDRMVNVFDKEHSGILHSDADVFLIGDGAETDNLKVYDLAKQLSYPAMVSTGDQFFPYALRPPGYEKIYSKFSYSRLIVDEVQAYDPKAAAIVVKFLEDIVFMGGKFLLMTATLPAFIKKEIENRIPNIKLPLNIYQEEKEKFSSTQKHVVQLKLIHNNLSENKPDFTIPANNLEEVIDKAKEGKRVLVVLNTVAQAQTVYSSLLEFSSQDNFLKEQENIWLLHSRFTLEKRRRIEREVVDKEFGNPKHEDEKVGKILVSTQIIEASLDIDADVMFTEIAALDALIQRMGRVLRRKRSDSGYKRNESETNIIIWAFVNGIESGRGYVYNNELLALSLKMLSDKASGKYENSYTNWLREKEIKKITIGTEEKTIKKKKSDEKDSSPIYICQSSFKISEYDKYEFAHKFYELPEDAEYLKIFYHTLAILDAGYMSDRRNEAQKIFREINDIQIIPESKLNEFGQAIVAFFREHQEENRLYTKFKKKVLAEFVVHIQRYKVKDELVSWNTLFERIKIEMIDNGLKNRYLGRIEKWVKGIYVIQVKYHELIGLSSDKPRSIDNLL